MPTDRRLVIGRPPPPGPDVVLHLAHGETAPHALDGFTRMLADLEVQELRHQCLKLREDYDEACRLAWDLFLAGTEQTPTGYDSAITDPVADVRAHVARLRADLAEAQADREAMAGRLRRPLEKRDIAGKSPAELALEGVSIRDAVRARLADAVKLLEQHRDDEVFAWLISAYSDCLELVSVLVPPADPAP